MYRPFDSAMSPRTGGGSVASRPVSRCLRSDGGFTLVESLVAMLLVVLFFVTFTFTVLGALRGSRTTRLAQTATAVVTEHLESARGLAWHELAMPYVDGTAPMIDGGTGTLLAAEAGMADDEQLVVSEWGIVTPSVTEVADGVEYTVWSFVSDAPDGMRRVTVLANWESSGSERSFKSSTLIAEQAGG